jgi:ATP phosphoribosyltransferase regulatory subunit
MSSERWLLPEGIEELLPSDARIIERLRRTLLDRCACWGYQLVMPPLVEFTDALLIGLGKDLDLLTCKVVDQLSGRTLGIRADITPQVARIDAHSHARDGVSRFCYAGSVLHSRPRGPLMPRSPFQLGAELYGDASPEADFEVIDLMLELLQSAGVGPVTLDLGHVGVCRAVLDAVNLQADDGASVFQALQSKSLPDLELALAQLTDADSAALILQLAQLNGDVSVLDRAEVMLAGSVPAAIAPVRLVRDLARRVQAQWPDVQLYIDLAELRGYHYHTGVVFAAYVAGCGQAVANGGRYDDVGAVFGRARPATGFNTDLRALLPLLGGGEDRPGAISAPAVEDAKLASLVRALRADGETVVLALSGAHDPRCDRQLMQRGAEWSVQPLAAASEA